MTNRFDHRNSQDWTTPAISHKSITPSDSVDVIPMPRALRIGNVGGGANLALEMSDGEGGTVNITYEGVAAGDVLQVRPIKVLSTGTTVSNIVAWW